MRKNLMILALAITVLVIMSQVCWADEQNPSFNWDVQVNPLGSVYKLSPEPFQVDPTLDGWWGLTVKNNTPDTIKVEIWDSTNVKVDTLIINPNAGISSKHLFDVGGQGKLPAQTKFYKHSRSPAYDSLKATGNVINYKYSIPSLTQWGLIGLVALILVTGIYLLVRRRKPVTA